MNNIDDKFREKLMDFQKAPPSEIWEGIEGFLQQGKKRTLIPVFWKYAAGILILIGFGSSLLIMSRLEHSSEKVLSKEEQVKPILESTPENSQMDEKNTIESQTIAEKKDIQENLLDKEQLPVFQDLEDRQNNIIAEQVREIKDEQEITPTAKHLISYEEIVQLSGLNDLPLQIDPTATVSHTIRKKAVMRTYSWNDLGPDLAEEVPQSDTKTFSLAAIVSPAYSYRDLGNISASLNESFNQAESGKINMGGGLNLGFSASRRFSIHSGIMYSRIGVGINDIQVIAEYRQSGAFNNLRNASNPYLISNSIGSIESGTSSRAKFDQSLSNADSPSREMITDTYLNPEGFYAPSDNYIRDDGSIDQYFQYLEVPLLFKYKVIDRKIDFNLLGGMSTNFLVGNKVLYTQNGYTETIGNTSNVRSVNYSGNIGMGIDYNLANRFHLLFEPQFKYYLNSINSDNLIGNRPYTIGFYSGFIYLF